MTKPLSIKGTVGQNTFLLSKEKHCHLHYETNVLSIMKILKILNAIKVYFQTWSFDISVLREIS